MSDRDELRQAVSDAISKAINARTAGGPLSVADAAIAAYEAHRPRVDGVLIRNGSRWNIELTREEWEAALDVVEDIVILRDFRFFVPTIREIQKDAIRAAFPFVKVEGE